jgi:hypothetical protein
MRTRDLIVGLVMAALAACSPPAQQKAPEAPAAGAPQAVAPTSDPATIVRPIYDRYLTQGADFPELRDQAPWSGELWSELEAMMHRTQAGDEPNLDFDPFVGAQDYRITDLNVTTEGVVEGSHAVVRASFKNLGDQTDILYDMVWDGHGWRVDNIRGRDWDLRRIAAQ